MAATWTNPVDRATNHVVTAAEWNALLGGEGNLQYLYEQAPDVAEGPVSLHTVGAGATAGILSLSSNTTAHVGAAFLPVPVLVTELSFQVTQVTTSGQLAIGIFSNDGQTRHINVVTGTISGTGRITVSVPSVSLAPGIYYVMFVPQGTAYMTVRRWNEDGAGPAEFAASTGKNEVSGTVTVTAGTIPATFDPDDDVSFGASRTVMVRLN